MPASAPLDASSSRLHEGKSGAWEQLLTSLLRNARRLQATLVGH